MFNVIMVAKDEADDVEAVLEGVYATRDEAEAAEDRIRQDVRTTRWWKQTARGFEMSGVDIDDVEVGNYLALEVVAKSSDEDFTFSVHVLIDEDTGRV